MKEIDNVIDIIKDGEERLINPIERQASRGIIIKNDMVAIINKVNKNEYKLPGGGIEDDETPKEAFYREILEETGCEVKIIDYLGIIIEEKKETNFKQISYVFVAEVVNDTNKLNFTKKETDEGAKMIWVPIKEALALIKESIKSIKGSNYDSTYSSLFMVKRDARIVEHYLIKKANLY